MGNFIEVILEESFYELANSQIKKQFFLLHQTANCQLQTANCQLPRRTAKIKFKHF